MRPTDSRAEPVAGPLRVLQVAPRYFPDLGGTETHVHEVVARLVTQPDLEITVFASDRSGRLPRTERGQGFDIIRRRSWPRGGDLYISPGLPRVIASGSWDVVHFQGIHTFIPILGMIAARRAGVPYVLTFHTGGHTSQLRTRLRTLQWRALTPLLRSSSRLITVSRFEQSLFRQATKLPADQFVTIRNGGALPRVATPVDVIPGRIISSGRLEKYKGHHRVIEALPHVRRAIPSAHLLILGVGPYEAELRSLATRLGVDDVVEIRQVPPGDRLSMSRELLQAQVVAAFSDYEAHPVAVMEALTLGVPVLGYDIAGTGDLITDGDMQGLSTQASPVEAAARLTDMLMQDPARDPRGAPRTALPTWETSASELAEVYRAAARRRPDPAGGPQKATRLRVVHVITTMVTGGAERQLELLATDPGVDARVICLYQAGPLAERLQRAGIDVEVLGMARGRKWSTPVRLGRRLRELAPDVVHVHLLSAQLWGLPAARLAHVPVVISTEHSLMENSIEGRPLHAWLKALIRALAVLPTHIIAVSDVAANRLTGLGVPARRISVITNAVDTSSVIFSADGRKNVRQEFGISGTTVVCGIVGRLDEVKRHAVAIEALAPEMSAGELHLLVVGDGPLRQALVRLVERLNLQDAVTFTGARADVGSVLSAMDVVVSPSRDETFGVAIVEALANGLPVVYEQAPALDALSPTDHHAQLVDPTLPATQEAVALRSAVMDMARVGRTHGSAQVSLRYGVDTMRSSVSALYRRLLVSSRA